MEKKKRICLQANGNELSDLTPKIILSLPICCHKTGDLVSKAVKLIIEKCMGLNPESSFTSVATDGDPHRRNIFNSMRQENENLIELKPLKHFHQKFLLGKYGINYDTKHLVKRIRSAIIGSQTMQLIKRPISKTNVKILLQTTEKTPTFIDNIIDVMPLLYQ